MQDLLEKNGKKTIFNLIGPLSSPVQVKRQVQECLIKMDEALGGTKDNGVVHAFIVHSEDGMDEIPFAKTNVIELKNKTIKELTIDPKTLGINLQIWKI